MNKLIYWLRKLGIYRSASYSVKGKADKLNEIHAKNEGMIQSQKEIDNKYEKESRRKISGKSERRGIKILFWIFAVLATLFILGFWGKGFSLGAFLMILLWIFFLVCVWRGKRGWTGSLVGVLILGLILSVCSIFFFDSSEEGEGNSSSKGDSQISENVQEEAKESKCDDSNSHYADFNKVEKVIVSKNPCKVPWILAKEVESYELKTKRGTVLEALVWNNYVNNVKAGESYTIRVLDIEDTGVSSDKKEKAGIAVVRWVKNKAALSGAKEEVRKVVAELDF